jgi:hypothetical protein
VQHIGVSVAGLRQHHGSAEVMLGAWNEKFHTKKKHEYFGTEGAHNFTFKSITGTRGLRHPDISRATARGQQ